MPLASLPLSLVASATLSVALPAVLVTIAAIDAS